MVIIRLSVREISHVTDLSVEVYSYIAPYLYVGWVLVNPLCTALFLHLMLPSMQPFIMTPTNQTISPSASYLVLRFRVCACNSSSITWHHTSHRDTSHDYHMHNIVSPSNYDIYNILVVTVWPVMLTLAKVCSPLLYIGWSIRQCWCIDNML